MPRLKLKRKNKMIIKKKESKKLNNLLHSFNKKVNCKLKKDNIKFHKLFSSKKSIQIKQ